MRISSFFYTLKQGIINIFRNKWFSLASMATISACLLLFGLFFAIVVNFNNIVKTAEQGVSVTVFFDDNLSDAKIQEIGQMIEKRTHEHVTNRKCHIEFFSTLADKRLFFRFSRLDLATNELPKKTSCLVCWALANHELIALPYEGCYYFCHICT